MGPPATLAPSGWWRLLAIVMVVAAMLAWSAYFLALSQQRWRWERWCAVDSPPFVTSQQERRAIRHASDWEKPLALGLAPWGCALAAAVRRMRRRKLTEPKPWRPCSAAASRPTNQQHKSENLTQPGPKQP